MVWPFLIKIKKKHQTTQYNVKKNENKLFIIIIISSSSSSSIMVFIIFLFNTNLIFLQNIRKLGVYESGRVYESGVYDG